MTEGNNQIQDDDKRYGYFLDTLLVLSYFSWALALRLIVWFWICIINNEKSFKLCIYWSGTLLSVIYISPLALLVQIYANMF